MNKEKTVIKLNLIVHFLFWLFVTVIFCIFLFDCIYVRRQDFVDSDFSKLYDNWQYTTADGDSGILSYPARFECDKGVPVEFSTLLPQVEDDYYFVIYTARDIKVYIDGELRNDFCLSKDPLFKTPIKNVYLFTKLSSEDSYKTVTVYKYSEKRSNGVLSEAYVCNMWGLINYACINYAFSFFVSFFFMILSFGFVCAGTIYFVVKKKSLDLTYLMLEMFFVGCWLFFDSRVYQLMFNNYIIDGIFAYFFVFLIPYPIIVYFDRITALKYRKIFCILSVAAWLNLCLFMFLHFMQIFSFGDALVYIDFNLVAICLSGFFVLLYDFFIFKNRSYKYFMIGVAGFFSFSLLEILSIYLHFQFQDGIFVILGLAFLVLFGGVQQFNQLNEIAKAKFIAEKESQAKTTFLANMSHELRTPINAIIGMNEIILRETQEDKTVEYAELIKKASNNLLDIVNDLLDISKIASGKMEIYSKDYNFKELIVELTDLFQELAGAKKLQCNIKVQSTLPLMLNGDCQRLKQIIINLLSNAVKYTSEGSVSFTVSREACDDLETCILKFVIADTGIGIDPQNIPLLFDSYTRLVDEDSKIEGTGLGLNIVKKLLDSMDGTIEVESEKGNGSVFTVTIPQKTANNNNEVIGNIFREKPNEHVGKKRYTALFVAPLAKILVIDDNSMNLLIVKKLLEKTLIKIDTADNAKTGLEMAAKKLYDLIIVDHMMPGIDGIEALHLLRKDDNSLSSDCKVIVLTANAVTGMKEMYLKEGFDDYLAKPIEPQLLEECLLKYLPEEYIVKEMK